MLLERLDRFIVACLYSQDVVAKVWAEVLVDVLQRMGATPAYYSLFPQGTVPEPWNRAMRAFYANLLDVSLLTPYNSYYHQYGTAMAITLGAAFCSCQCSTPLQTAASP